MELLEIQDPEKRKFIEASERHKRALEKEVKQISDKTEQITKNALIIGGALALTYLLVSHLGDSEKSVKKNKKNSGVTDAADAETHSSEASLLSKIGSRVVDQATLILFDLAKEKLSEFLQSRKNEHS
jgi:branched-subunit amino acid permease